VRLRWLKAMAERIDPNMNCGNPPNNGSPPFKSERAGPWRDRRVKGYEQTTTNFP
jgi:hypothetical protein